MFTVNKPYNSTIYSESVDIKSDINLTIINRLTPLDITISMQDGLKTYNLDKNQKLSEIFDTNGEDTFRIIIITKITSETLDFSLLLKYTEQFQTIQPLYLVYILISFTSTIFLQFRGYTGVIRMNFKYFNIKKNSITLANIASSIIVISLYLSLF